MADEFLGNIIFFFFNFIKFSVGKAPRQNKALNVRFYRSRC